MISTNCGCYKKLRLAAVVAAAVAKTLVAKMVVLATVFYIPTERNYAPHNK